MNIGLIGKKIGMTHRFLENGSVVPVTVVQAGPCSIVQVKTVEKDGYNAVQLGFGEPKRGDLLKPRTGQFNKTGLEPMGYLKEFHVPETDEFNPGDTLTVGVFSKGDIVDVSGISKGKGFTGVVKRYNFRGGSRSHGTHKRHRAPGSIGASSYPSKVFKGKRMAGHMGNERVTIQNLSIVDIDKANNLLLIKGAVPGPRNGMVIIKKGIKARHKEGE